MTSTDSSPTTLPAYSGPHLRDKTPSLWVVPWVGFTDKDTGKERIYIVVRDPFITRGERDNESFVQPPSRGLFPHEMSVNEAGEPVILLNKAIDGIVHYYTGLRTEGTACTEPAVEIDREGTAVYSGAAEGRQVVSVMQCLGRNLTELPAIRSIADGGSYPPALEGNEAALAFCNNYRRHVAFVDFEGLMHSLTQRGPINPLIYSPAHTPFYAKGLEIMDGARFTQDPNAEMPVQGAVLHVLEKAADRLGVSRGTPPDGRDRWVTKETIATAIEALDNGTYKDDPRVIAHRSERKATTTAKPFASP